MSGLREEIARAGGSRAGAVTGLPVGADRRPRHRPDGGNTPTLLSTPRGVESIVLMDAFLPGVGDWTTVWLLRDLWHFHFYGETPPKLVAGRERTYFEHFWNDFAADRTRSVAEKDRQFYARTYAQPGGMRAGFEYFKAFEQDAKDFAEFAKNKLPMPMLVLTGEKASGEFLIQQGKLVAHDVRGVIIKNSGHWLIDEAPEQTMSELVTFLDAAAPARRCAASRQTNSMRSRALAPRQELRCLGHRDQRAEGRSCSEWLVYDSAASSRQYDDSSAYASGRSGSRPWFPERGVSVMATRSTRPS